jgi:hypothetical protein
MVVELVCPACEMRTTLDEIDIIYNLALCSVCLKKKKHNILVCAAHYDAEQRQKELAKRLYCRNCDHIGLIEQFPFDAPPDEDSRERRCPRCHGDNLINMGQAIMCEQCDEAPAIKGDVWCRVCVQTYNKLEHLQRD